jgi:hypothetical protein
MLPGTILGKEGRRHVKEGRKVKTEREVGTEAERWAGR